MVFTRRNVYWPFSGQWQLSRLPGILIKLTADSKPCKKIQKSQITNYKQISNSKSQFPNRIFFSFVILVIVICNLSLKKRGTSFVIWCLGFVISSCSHAIMRTCYFLGSWFLCLDSCFLRFPVSPKLRFNAFRGPRSNYAFLQPNDRSSFSFILFPWQRLRKWLIFR